MNSLLIRNVRIVRPSHAITLGDVYVHDGRIAAVGDLHDAPLPDAEPVDGQGRLLTPGLIDLHTHGILQFAYEAGAESLRRAARELGRFGITTVVPTIIPRPDDDGFDRLRELADALPSVEGVHIPGLHLEGPFVAIGGAACPTLPGNLDLLGELLAAARERVSVMSVSPDTPDIIPVIRELRRRHITVFVTHTRASVEQTDAAILAGASHATHFYDVFPAPAETDPGVRPVGAVEAILAARGVTVDFIADGVHVHPAAVRAALAAKTHAGVALITDSNVGAGLPDGVYDTPWGYPVRVRAGDAARHATKNFLAGSALTMDRGIANLLRWLDLPPEQVWAMGTETPARILGLTGKGRIEPGADADLVLWNGDLTVERTWLAGIPTYART